MQAGQAYPGPVFLRSGVTSPNPCRSVEQPMKSQSGVYWNNAEQVLQSYAQSDVQYSH